METVDRVAESAGDAEIWQRIRTAFRIGEDRGAIFALFDSLDAVINMAEELGLDGIRPLASAIPIIRAVHVVLLRTPDQVRHKLGNPRYGVHRCSKSPAEFALLCSYTTEIADKNIVSRVTALRALVLLGVVDGRDPPAQLKVVADGLRKVQSCWRATNIDQERALNFDQAFYCVANYTTVDKSTRL